MNNMKRILDVCCLQSTSSGIAQKDPSSKPQGLMLSLCARGLPMDRSQTRRIADLEELGRKIRGRLTDSVNRLKAYTEVETSRSPNRSYRLDADSRR